MKLIHFTQNSYLLLLLMASLALLSCEEEEVLDDRLQVLSQKIDGANATNGDVGISKNASVELIFSHTLNTTALEAALSLTGGSGNPAFTFDYSNTNSTLTLVPTADLDFETTYTLSLPAGVYGNLGEELREAFNLSFTTAPFIPANVSLSVDKAGINESGDTAVVSLTLSEAVELDVQITLGFGGSATQNTDYTTTSSSLTINAGDSSVSMEIRTTQDMMVEGTETIDVEITQVVNAEELSPQSVSINLLDDDIDSNNDGFPDQGFIINEVLFDPPSGSAGDANGDGTRSASADEFIEFINDSDQAVDLSGFSIYDANNLPTLTPRHTFPMGTVVNPGEVYLLFGGGTPTGDFGTATVAVSSSGNLNLTNSDDVITILDAQGNVFLTFDTQVEGMGISFGSDQSVTRNPDINGDFALHTTANASADFSPGKKVDNTNFPGNTPINMGVGFIINEVLFDPPSGSSGDANGDGTRSASADEFIEFVNDSDQSVDLSGYTVFDATNLMTMTPRHTFPANTVIAPGEVYVLFGGGTPSGSFGGATVATSTTGNLNLSNGGDVITILDTNGNVFITFDTSTDGNGIDFGSDQSVTRSPDLTGNFVLHTTSNGSLLFSPGTQADGNAF